MKAMPITRIAVSLTLDEARDAVVNATELQLALRAALTEFDPLTVVEQVAAFNHSHQRLAAPKKRTRFEHQVCPHCARKITAGKRYEKHLAVCKARPPEA